MEPQRRFENRQDQQRPEAAGRIEGNDPDRRHHDGKIDDYLG